MDDISVAMFAVASQDAAIAFYTEKLGFELRADTRFWPNGEYRWVELRRPAPMPGWPSTSRWAEHPVVAASALRQTTCWLSTGGLAPSAASTSIPNRCRLRAPRCCS